MILSLKDVSFSYQHKRRTVNVLSGINLEINDGERLALIGPSGSGKSTILNLASGILVPESGSISLAGHSLEKISAAKRAELRLHHVAHIYQDFRLFDKLTALENVAFLRRLRGENREESMERARICLTKVGMQHRFDHLPAEISGGERQRVAIARALAAEPDLVLADEPTGSLDADKRDEILDVMFDVLDGSAFLIVTHDKEVAQRASRVIAMTQNGTIAAAVTS